MSFSGSLTALTADSGEMGTILELSLWKWRAGKIGAKLGPKVDVFPVLGNPHTARVSTFPQRRRRLAPFKQEDEFPLKSRSLSDSCTEPKKGTPIRPVSSSTFWTLLPCCRIVSVIRADIRVHRRGFTRSSIHCGLLINRCAQALGT